MRTTVALLGMIAVAVPSAAQEEERAAISRCAEIVGGVERLDCYDRLAQGIAADAPVQGSQGEATRGGWEMNESINPLDDSRTVTLALVASSGRSRFGQPVALLLRCQSGDIEVYISWSDYLGSSARVTTRVGSNEAETKGWSLSTDSQATFYPDNDREFVIFELMNATRLVARVTPYGESPVTAVFDLTGLSAVTGPLFDACPG